MVVMRSLRRYGSSLRTNPVTFLLSVVFVLLLLVGGLLISVHANSNASKARGATQTEVDQEARDLQCIANYENASRTRTEILTALNTKDRAAQRRADDANAASNRALAQIVAASQGPPVAPVTAHRLLATLAFRLRQADSAAAAHRLADDAYNRALVEHPIPEPVFACSNRLGGTHAGPTPTPSSSPSTVTTTVSGPTSTHNVTAPGATRTATVPVIRPTTIVIPGPGRTVTQTVTQTRTRTVTPSPLPNCLSHPIPPCVVTIP